MNTIIPPSRYRHVSVHKGNMLGRRVRELELIIQIKYYKDGIEPKVDMLYRTQSGRIYVIKEIVSSYNRYIDTYDNQIVVSEISEKDLIL